MIKKTKKAAPIKSTQTLITPKGRLSYPHLLERNTGGEYPSDKYETLLLIPKTANIDNLLTACEALMLENFEDEFESLEDLKNPPIRDGDMKGGEYAGHWFIKAKSDNKPGIVGPDPTKTVDNPEMIFGGQNAKLSLNAYVYNTKGNKGVAWGLKNVQILGGGESFGGGAGNPSDQFEAVEEVESDGF